MGVFPKLGVKIMYCLIWKRNGNWELFTNEVWLHEKDARNYALQNKFKKSVEWKIADYKDWFKPNS
jgi:hypothetical protein